MKRDLNAIAQIEKAIVEKYGKIAITNPKSEWNVDKEKRYLEFLKKESLKEQHKQFYLQNSFKQCKFCKDYSSILEDDLCLNKYECCYACYVSKIEEKRILKNEN